LFCSWLLSRWFVLFGASTLKSAKQLQRPNQKTVGEGSFFGQLKEELYRHQRFSSSIKFMAELDTYIHWYNHVRIREKLRGLSPRQYRMQFRQSGTTALIDKRTTDGCT